MNINIICVHIYTLYIEEISQTKGKVISKVLKIWKPATKRIVETDWKRNDFIKVVNNVKDAENPIYDSLCTLLACLDDKCSWDGLAVYVRLIYDIHHHQTECQNLFKHSILFN